MQMECLCKTVIVMRTGESRYPEVICTVYISFPSFCERLGYFSTPVHNTILTVFPVVDREDHYCIKIRVNKYLSLLLSYAMEK